MTLDDSPHVFSVAGVRDRAQQFLAGREPGVLPRRGDYDLNPELLPEAQAAIPNLQPAAVLVPVINRSGDEMGQEAQLLFTVRTEHLSAHAGQVSFPGGKIDPGDNGCVVEAALREAEEEVGLDRSHVEVLGQLDNYQTGTGFHIHPVLAIVSSDAHVHINEEEVSDYFHVPLGFAMTPRNFEKHKREWQGKDRAFYALRYQERYIWGATAGIVRNLCERLYGLKKDTFHGAGGTT